MDDASIHHEDVRRLQNVQDTRGIAYRLRQVTLRSAFTHDDKTFIERSSMLFVPTADPSGRPDCSYNGGLPGVVRVLDESALAIPGYDGNGMCRTTGNAMDSPDAGLPFIDFEIASLIRGNRTATFREDEPLIGQSPGAVFVVRVTARHPSPNCLRYIHRMKLLEHSVYSPRALYTLPDPERKSFETFRESLPARDRPDPGRAEADCTTAPRIPP